MNWPFGSLLVGLAPSALMATLATVEPPSSFSFTTPFSTPAFPESAMQCKKTAIAAHKRIAYHSFADPVGAR